MFELIHVNLEKKMNETLHYVATQISNTGHNSKPVLLHCFKVGMTLYSYKYSEDIILGGIMHDLIEDTDVNGNEIEEKYGKKIRSIVEAVSFDPKIEDKLEQAKKMFKNCIDYGYDALIVKCADLLDNINFVNLVENLSMRNKLLKKYQIFLEMTKEIIGEEAIYILLKSKYEATISAK